MRILVTNDDGIDAPGIRALWQELSDIGTVDVVAPDSERSATSHAITVHTPIVVCQCRYDDCLNSSWRVGGTPADCVKLAIEALLPARPDLIVSGINRGPNLGTDVLYSGTVSAAIEGTLYSIPSIAVSLDSFSDSVSNYIPAAKFVCKLVTAMQGKQISPKTMLNVNVPALPEDDIIGYTITKLGNRQYQNVFEKRLDPRGRTYYWLGGKIIDEVEDADADVSVIREGKISITPINFNLTNHQLLEQLRQWEL